MMPPAAAENPPQTAAAMLAGFIRGHARLVILTGAGCSTGSGIPDYRDREGHWKREPPVQFLDFVASAAVRRRYWARSLLGWRRIAEAQPNGAHHALAGLERAGFVRHLITQNVDGLHQKAGSRRVTDLHGCLDAVVCLACGASGPRERFQARLAARNPRWLALTAGSAPDGDADLDGVDFSAFEVPDCEACDGLLKPAVVFFGEALPAVRSTGALAEVQQADALLAVGTSLMVWSGFRLA
ncbi:MAG: NAD-dependent protein deacetylase, partial [Gammaproteobacteria bacterium]|nr:NAD-dependent protein deacetylase [Gammaproteobacteria bacterium]